MKKITKTIIVFILSGIFIFLFVKNISNSKTDINSEDVDFLLKENVTEGMIDNSPNIEEPHFTHTPITYQIETGCRNVVKERIKLAFTKIQEETDEIVTFEEVVDDPDISIFCEESPIGTSSSAGEGEKILEEAIPYFSDNKENIIINGEIVVYGYGYVCGSGYPKTEVHEILHTLGFAHDYSIISNNIMEPYAEASSKLCKTTQMNRKYSLCLKYIYSDGIQGECSNINFLTYEDFELMTCEEMGFFPALNSEEFCCSEPNMIIDEEGYCV